MDITVLDWSMEIMDKQTTGHTWTMTNNENSHTCCTVGYPPIVAIVTNNNVRTTCMTVFIVCHCSGVASCLHVRNLYTSLTLSRHIRGRKPIFPRTWNYQMPPSLIMLIKMPISTNYAKYFPNDAVFIHVRQKGMNLIMIADIGRIPEHSCVS